MKNKRPKKLPAAVPPAAVAATTPTSFWGVMKAHDVRGISCGGYPMQPAAEGPHFFIPLFTTREQAVAFAHGDEQHIAHFSSYTS